MSDALRQLVESHLPPLVVRLRPEAVAALVDKVRVNTPRLGPMVPSEVAVDVVWRAIQALEEWNDGAARVSTEFEGFRDAWFGHPERAARLALGENVLRAQTSDRATLRADLRALDRRLDFDAFAERFVRRRRLFDKRAEVAAIFAAQAAAALAEDTESSYGICLALVERLRVDLSLGRFIEEVDRPWAARLDALDGLIRFYRGLHQRALFDRASATTLRRLLRIGNDLDAHPLLRARAMEIATLLPPDEGRPMITRALKHREGEPADAFLARARIVELVARALPPEEAVNLLADQVWTPDPSEHVRQALARAMALRADDGGLGPLTALAGQDPHIPEEAPRVRAMAARATLSMLIDGPRRTLAEALADLVARIIEGEPDWLPLRVLAEDLGEATLLTPEPIAPFTWRFRAAIDIRLADPRLPPAVIETLAWARNRLDLADAPEQQALVGRLRDSAAQLPEGGQRTFALGIDVETPAMRRAVGRALADLSRRDLGLAASLRGRRIKLWRGDRRRRRLWRVLHELRRPAPSKRVGHRHTLGRVPRGELRAPPGLMDEVVPTTVPGERVQIRGEEGWGRHLPGIDDLLAVPLSGRETHIYSDFGVTTIEGAGGPLTRLRARASMTWRYAELAELRRASLASDEPAARARFAAELRRRYGIALRFEPYADDMPVPPRIDALFARVDALEAPPDNPAVADGGARDPVLGELGGGAAGFVAAVDLETIGQAFAELVADSAAFLLSWAEGGQPALALFLAGILTWLFLRARHRQQRIEFARSRIRLSIGGWGTRGKSGTERLKAALFHGLGYDVFVKTTGCEAVMMHSVAGRRPIEVFIHRPYDKATIWEQRDMLELASAMNAEVFLWECMGLNPRYVSVLQHDWMNDDLATITNAYPDHEDVMGPSGDDVARSISTFVPQAATLVTSEENFLPLIAEQSRARGTRMVPVSPLDAELIAEDVRALFPYDEHPRNMALVARLARELGVDPDLALHTMARHVVPDLGVLKRYPTVRVRGRQLEFVNGMSANERKAFLDNWSRSGLDHVSLTDTPERRVVTVVNNRGDRIPRSEVFAQILVNDIAADRHVLIGTNLTGLMGYIETALDARLATVALIKPADLEPGGDPHQPRARLDAEMSRLRIPPPTLDMVSARLRVYADGLEREVDPEALSAAVEAAGVWLGGDGEALEPDAVAAEIARDQSWRSALTTLFEGRPAIRVDGPPEAVTQATADDAAAAADRMLVEMIIHARLIKLLEEAVAGHRTPAVLHQIFVGTWRRLFLDRLVVVDDPTATGDQIIDICSQATPPGTAVTVMGIQNIKGTGLDFIYRWVAIDNVHGLLTALDSEDEGQRIDALRELAELVDPGLIGVGMARARLAVQAEMAAGAEERSALEYARRRLDEQFQVLLGALSQKTERGPVAWLLDRLESTIDLFDALRRTRSARRIVNDLVNERISHEQAALEMRVLNQRGKGGWLARALGR